MLHLPAKYRFLFPLIMAVAVLLAASATASAARLGLNLQNTLLSAAVGEQIPIIVTMAEQVETASFASRTRGRTRRAARAELVQSLRHKAEITQQSLKAFIKSRGIKKHKQLWIINGLVFKANPALISTLATFPGVASITQDIVIHAPEIIPAATPVTAQWNLKAVRATDLWNLGFTGTGVVVANMDSGVDWNHQDIVGNYRGGVNSWYDPYGEHLTPYDKTGHGTAVMGVLAGGETDAVIGGIGVAPDTQWIAAKVFNDAGNSSDSATISAFQWLLDPDLVPATDDVPDIVNMSWGFSSGLCDTRYQISIQNLKAAGIAVAISAGNNGPGADTSTSPANYPEGFAVGATDQNSSLASSSGRGPSACDNTFFPEVVAPGVSIVTSDLTLLGVFPDSYWIVQGTSFSAPHAAGVMALLLEAFPAATVAELETALEQSASDLGSPGPDNEYGYGLINGLAAYRYLNDEPYLDVYDPVAPEHDRIVDFFSVSPGTSLSRTVKVRNSGQGSLVIDNIDDTVLASSSFSIMADFCSGATLLAGESCDLDIEFLPEIFNSFQVTLAISSNNIDENPVNISLAGIGNNPPAAATLIAPANASSVFGATVTFQWIHPTDPDGEPVTDSLYISESSDFSQSTPIVVVTSSLSLQMGLLSGAMISMLISAFFSGSRRRVSLFKILAVLTVSVLLLISCDGGGGGVSVAAYTDYTSSGLKSGATYYWKVVSADGSGGVAESSTWHFTTQ